MKRARNFHMQLSDLELEQLRELAERSGLTQSSYLRQLLRNEWRAFEEARK